MCVNGMISVTETLQTPSITLKAIYNNPDFYDKKFIVAGNFE
jgi:hypothetical protein